MGNDHRWVFGGTGNTVADSLGNVIGTFSGNVSREGPGRYGIGNVLQIQSPGDSHVDFGTGVGQFGTDSFTVMLWFLTQDHNPNSDLVGNRFATSHGNFFSLRMNGSQGFVVAEVDQDGSGTNYCAAQSAGGLNNDQWHHVAVVRAGPSLTLYVDGQLAVQNAGKGVAKISNNNPWRLGRSPATSTTGNIMYADLGVYGDELSPDDIYHIYCFH